MKRVLVTGASGFVGLPCLAALTARNYEVHAVCRTARPGPAAAKVRWHRFDLLEPDAISELMSSVQPTHLLHCAWYAVPGKYWTARENFRWVEAGMHLLDAFAKQGGRRVVGVGSCAEYDWRYGQLAELTTPLNPATTYGACKHAFQLLLMAFSKQSDLSAAWGRLFFLYGPHEPAQRLVASAIQSMLQEEPALTSHGRQIRDFLYVQDAADALAALLDSDVVGPVNIASGTPVTVMEVVRKIADLLERPHLVKSGEVLVPANEPPVLVADVKRLHEEVGWSPRYDLAAGLTETIAWWKQQNARGANE